MDCFFPSSNGLNFFLEYGAKIGLHIALTSSILSTLTITVRAPKKILHDPMKLILIVGNYVTH